MESNARKCFLCDENPREEGDFMCRSCKEEHPMCYDCGSRKRNLPFKLCGECYKSRRQSDNGAAFPSGNSSFNTTSSIASSVHVNDGNDDSGSQEDEVETAISELCVESDSDGKLRVYLIAKNYPNIVRVHRYNSYDHIPKSNI